MAARAGQRKSRAADRVTQSDAIRDKTAILFAADDLRDPAAPHRSDQSIADEVGVSRSTITRWKRDPEFQAMIQDARAKIKADALRLPMAQVHERVKVIDRLTGKLLEAVDLRAKTYAAMADTPEEAARQMFGSSTPPWAATGLYVAKQKISASGKVVTDWEADTATIREVRANFEHIAKQLQQWDESVTLNHNHNEYHDDRYARASVETLEKIDELLSGDA